MLRSISKQSGKSVESVLKKKKKGCGGKDLQKRKVLSLEWKSEWVMEHTRPFNGPISGTTEVSQYRKVKQSGFYWSKRQWVAVASAGPYASLHLAPDS